jgi:hypothetical protein
MCRLGLSAAGLLSPEPRQASAARPADGDDVAAAPLFLGTMSRSHVDAARRTFFFSLLISPLGDHRLGRTHTHTRARGTGTSRLFPTYGGRRRERAKGGRGSPIPALLFIPRFVPSSHFSPLLAKNAGLRNEAFALSRSRRVAPTSICALEARETGSPGHQRHRTHGRTHMHTGTQARTRTRRAG